MSDKTVKRKQLMNIADKIATIGEVNSGAKTQTYVCRKYNLPLLHYSSTLLNNEEKLIKCFPYNSKVRKRQNYNVLDLDEVLLNWFKQQRNS
ncbi:hypothetical protein QE152_g4638 [Popillia japonica]|uniref:DNA-binding protein n=1 Tax=Popillia japonica TaxID=7064 RepID=A0AAW1MWZ7_POPJA